MSTDRHVASYESGVSDVSSDNIGVITDDVSPVITNEEWCHNIAKCIDLSTNRYIPSHETRITDVSRDNIGIVTDDVASDVTDEEGCHNVAKCIDLSTDRNVASYEPCVPDVSDDANNVVHICIIAYDIANDVRRHCGWYRSSRCYSFEQRPIASIERRCYIT